MAASTGSDKGYEPRNVGRHVWQWIMAIPEGAMPTAAAFAMGQALAADQGEAEGVMALVAAIYAWREHSLLVQLAREQLRHHRVIVPCMEGGLYVGEIETIPGALAYGATEEEAREKTRALGLAVLIDRLRHGE